MGPVVEWLLVVAVVVAFGAAILRPSSMAYGDARYAGARFGVPGDPIDPSMANRPAASSQPGGEFQHAAREALASAPMLESEPSFQRAEPLAPPGQELLWRPTFKGVQSTFVDAPCLAHTPSPRLWATSLNEIMERRARVVNATYPEPLANRQAWLQLLTYDWRGRRDLYTRPSTGNTFEIHRACDNRRPLQTAARETEGPRPSRTPAPPGAPA